MTTDNTKPNDALDELLTDREIDLIWIRHLNSDNSKELVLQDAIKAQAIKSRQHRDKQWEQAISSWAIEPITPKMPTILEAIKQHRANGGN